MTHEPRFNNALIKIGRIIGKSPESIWPSSEIDTYALKHPLLCLPFCIMGARMLFDRKIAHHYNIAIITRVLGMSLSKAMGPILALELTEAAISDTSFRKALRHAQGTVLRGGRISEAFLEFPALFPNELIRSVRSAELIGGLNKTFLDIADIYEGLIEKKLNPSRDVSQLGALSDLGLLETCIIFCILMISSTLILLLINPL